MIKVINLVSLLSAPVIIAYQKPGHESVGMFITGALSVLAIIIASITFSKRGGFKKTGMGSIIFLV
jgi:hypothetical protein